jgi:hypothetical protein
MNKNGNILINRTINIMKATRIMFAMVVAIVAMTGCNSGETSTPLGKLCGVYATIAENNQEVADAYQEMYKAPREQQVALHEKAVQLFKQKQAENNELGEKAKTLAEQLQGTELACEVDPALGYTVNKLIFARVDANDKLANIVLKGEVNGNASGFAYILMLNRNGVVTRTVGQITDNTLTINFRVTTNDGPETALAYGSVTSIRIITEVEYRTGKAPAESAVTEDAAVSEEPAEPEGEPAYIGDDETCESLVVNGITIKKGDPIVETLKKFKNVTWEYNADSGVIAYIGNVWIVVDEVDDLTPKGREFMNGIYSDMVPDLQFSVDYIKPAAKIKELHDQ